MTYLSNQPLKGMHDTYPFDMYNQLWVEQQFDEIASLFTYEKYNTPLLESIDMFLKKTSKELIEQQSYHLYDRGNRHLILRPEITPSLARMVSNYYLEKPKPFRLYTIGNCYRYERPQKGRLREFRQINFDFLGGSSFEMNLEIVNLIKNIMDHFNVQHSDYSIEFNFKNILILYLEKIKITQHNEVLNIIDKKNKITSQKFEELLLQHMNKEQLKSLHLYFEYNDILLFLNEHLSDKKELIQYIKMFLSSLKNLDLYNALNYNPTIVRGLDYYNEFIFEVFDKSNELNRALFGGGRYDNLLQHYTKDKMESCGFAIGFYIFYLFLSNKNLIPSELKPMTCQIFYTSNDHLTLTTRIATKIRQEKKIPVNVKKTSMNIKKYLSKLEKHVQFLIIVGEDEYKTNSFKIKNLISKHEEIRHL